VEKRRGILVVGRWWEILNFILGREKKEGGGGEGKREMEGIGGKGGKGIEWDRREKKIKTENEETGRDDHPRIEKKGRLLRI
jgi:hypothetical protein